MRPAIFALLATAVAAVPSSAQTGACCGTPTVAYSPVVAPAPTVAYSPVTPPPVVQTTTVSDSWYPGKYLADFTRNLFGGGRSTTTTYTAGYAPYTAGYAPYTAGYAPAYQPATSVMYRPTYPASYGPVVQSVSRPVVLSPVVSAPACNACDACSGVSQAAYQAPVVSDCASCSAAPPSYSAPLTPTPATPGSSTPQPILGPTENPDADRSDLFKPSPADSIDDLLDSPVSPPADEAASSGDYWGAPPLFQGPSNSNRVTARHPAPVHQAVYREPTGAAWTSAKAPAAAPKVIRLDASGWRAGN